MKWGTILSTTYAGGVESASHYTYTYDLHDMYQHNKGIIINIFTIRQLL